jgi:hypothetical protein
VNYLHILVFACDRCKRPAMAWVISADMPCDDCDLDNNRATLACCCGYSWGSVGAKAMRRFGPIEWPHRIGLVRHA